MTRHAARIGVALLTLAVVAPAAPPDADPTIGRSYRIPYRLTNTNHYLVRVRINGKGPFNFLVDSGAPALYVGTTVAKAIGLKAAEEDFWTPIERLDLEGGATLKDVKARVEDPFQLTGMNALGLPGASIDGILGFTILARFKLEFDPTKDRMTWTRIDYQPREPFVPRLPKGAKAQVPAEVQAMQMLGPMMKVAAVIVGKQPEDVLHPRGFLGVELAEPQPGDVRIVAVLADTPASRGGVRAGDRLARVAGREIDGLKSAHAAVADLRQDAEVKVEVRRGEETLELTLTAGEGF
jgi:hypothetical protein